MLSVVSYLWYRHESGIDLLILLLVRKKLSILCKIINYSFKKDKIKVPTEMNSLLDSIFGLICISALSAGWESPQTPDSLPLDALEMLLIAPYAAFHMGHFLILTRVSFLLLFLPNSLVVLPPRPFVSVWISPFIFFQPLSHFFIFNSLSLCPYYLSHIFILVKCLFSPK